MPVVIVRHSSGKLERFELPEGEVRVGRGEECELQLPNVSVSRLHCTMSVGQFGVTVHDSGSQNGILINGEPTSEHTLQNGDSIEIGRFALVYLADTDRDRFYKGRNVQYLPEYKPTASLTGGAGVESTFAMTAEDLQRISGVRQLVDEGKLVSIRDPNQFWYPESRPLTLGGGDSYVKTEGWFHWGPVARVTWNGSRHVITGNHLFIGVRVNDQKITEHVLKDGDIIRIGRSSFKYEEPEDPRAARKKKKEGGARVSWTPGG